MASSLAQDLDAQSNQDHRLMDPTGRGQGGGRPLAPRLDTLQGKTIGLLDNTKTNANVFLKYVGQYLVEDHGVKAIVARRKPTISPGAGPIIPDLVSQCDAVVNAYGDCGSCTSWVIYDSVELEKLDIPTATVESDEFVILGQMEAGALGVPGLPIVTVPHPMGDVPEAEIAARAKRAMPQVLHCLTGDSLALEEEFLGRKASESHKLRDGGLSCPI